MAQGGQSEQIHQPQIQYADRIRLERIFMPKARAARDTAVLSTTPQRFVHYTTAENAIKIIGSKRLWMRNTNVMSDYSEVEHGLEIVDKWFTNNTNRRRFSNALDLCHSGAAEDGIAKFYKLLRSIRLHTYIASISEHGSVSCDKQNSAEDRYGRLSMWRGFGGGTECVAFVLNIPAYSGAADALNIMFSPVAYLSNDDVGDVFDDVIKRVGENRDFLQGRTFHQIAECVFTMLFAGVTSLKHEAFSEEREWRAIYNPDFTSSQLMEESRETVTLRGIPQQIYKLPLDKSVNPSVSGLDLAAILYRVIIGPTAYPSPIYDALREALDKAGVPDAGNKIIVSGIPLRGA